MVEINCAQCNTVLVKGEKLFVRKNITIYCGNCFVGKSNKGNKTENIPDFLKVFGYRRD